MQVAGIMAEWNPLHRGHLLPLREARRRGATHIVAILSGNYVQRGEPALCPWPYRAAAALHSGVDLVLQLPLPYATATADLFRSGGLHDVRLRHDAFGNPRMVGARKSE